MRSVPACRNPSFGNSEWSFVPISFFPETPIPIFRHPHFLSPLSITAYATPTEESDLTALGSQLNGDNSSAGLKRWMPGGDDLTIKGMSLGFLLKRLWPTWNGGQMEGSKLVPWVPATLWGIGLYRMISGAFIEWFTFLALESDCLGSNLGSDAF